jgi:gentisate 1,2-dioxygenase
MAAFSQLIPAKFETRPYRCTDGTVYVCLRGSVQVTVETKSFSLEENDVLVVPSWHSHQFRAGPETVLFSYSDRPVQQALGLWREHRT